MKIFAFRLTGLAAAALLLTTFAGIQRPIPTSGLSDTAASHTAGTPSSTTGNGSQRTTATTTGPVEVVPQPVGPPSASSSVANGQTASTSASRTSGSAASSATQKKTAAATTNSKSTAASPAPNPTPAGKTVVGYYGGWASYKGYAPGKIPVGRLTHLHYAFANIHPSTGKIALSDPTNDRKNFSALRALKKSNPHLNTLISVGGWDYSAHFSSVAATEAKRQVFAQSVVDFIVEHGFDGVDLDWEYPVSGGAAGNGNRPVDKQNFTLLLRAVRAKLDQQGGRDGRRYILSIAGGAGAGYLSKIEPKSVAGVVDYIFVMGYDIHGPWDTYADLNAPLYTPAESAPHYTSSVNDSVRAYLNSGVPARKLVLGMPLYGYIYQGVGSANNGLYSAYSSAKSISYDALRQSYLGNAAYKKLRHETAKVPYLYGNRTFISYEDAQSIAAKAALAKSLGLSGVGVWELSHDTSGTLLNSAYQTLY